MVLRDKRGISLVIAFLVIVVLLILGSVFILRAVSESYAARKEKNSIQAFFLGESGANVGLKRIDLLINTDMMGKVNSTNPQVLVRDISNRPNYVGNGDGIGFLVAYTTDENLVMETADEATYTSGSISLGNGTYEYVITFTENGDPHCVPSGSPCDTDIWEFPYNYEIAGTGDVQSTRRTVLLTGDFTVRVQRDNFARYALFTDHHRLESGTTVWFTSNTHFYGPVHTNEQFSFAFNPVFDGLLTQHLDKACFSHNGCIDADSYPPYDVPIFNAGFDRGVDEISLESSVAKKDLIDQAWGKTYTPAPGIYVSNDGSNLTAGIYVQGDCTISMGVDGSGNATYNITRGTTTNIITVDYGDEEISGDEHTTVQVVGGLTNTYNGIPDGVDDIGTIIYVDGQVSSFGGTVQSQSQVTVSSENDIIIQDNVLYEDYTPASGTLGEEGYVAPIAEGTTNLLGILSWGGDVRIGTSAPNDISIHGTVMARGGIFTVDNYSSGSPRGAATLLGGVITQFYGAFGTFNGSTGQQVSGYGRNFIYDGRMGAGESPPYFPSMKTFVAFTNDITDKINWQEGES